MRNTLRKIRSTIRLPFYIALLAQATLLVFQPDPRDSQRAADHLFNQGHYHAALHAYLSLSSQHNTAEIALRVGILRAIRGEYDLAERALRRAMSLHIQGEQHHLTTLYLGHVLIRRGQPLNAMRIWSQIGDCATLAPRCRYDGPRRILRAEWYLQQSDYAAAETDYRAALDRELPLPWRELTIYRLALLQSAKDPHSIHEMIRQSQSQHTESPDPFLRPLLPTDHGSLPDLLAILASEPTTRPQLLGQFYLNQNLYGLAEKQFTQIAPDNPNALAAAAYVAYTQWRSGDTHSGLERLQNLVTANPDEPRARTLLALAYLSDQDTTAARDQLNTIRTLAPTSPNTHLAWANWYVANHDYVNAGMEYQRALAKASPEQRGQYALLIAQFHLNNTYDLCSVGLPAAQLAVQLLPNTTEAWTTLAAHRYYCGNFSGAAEAARTALARTPNAPAAFYLGAALTILGDPINARQTFIQAVDLAPASIWRERSEAALANLP